MVMIVNWLMKALKCKPSAQHDSVINYYKLVSLSEIQQQHAKAVFYKLV